MGLRSSIRKALLRKRLKPSRFARLPEVRAFIDKFRRHFVATELVRIGGDGDGGYLVPDALKGITHCFSPGVSDTADFESELSRDYGIKSFMADASVSAPPFEDPNFAFSKLFLGTETKDEFITLSDWMAASLDGSEGGLLLQMDIEGAEFGVLTVESADTLARFSVLIIEFHEMQRLFDKFFLATANALFDKLFLNFSICHVHPNNYAGLASHDGIDIPRYFEVTFVRNDILQTIARRDAPSLPHPLDRPCVEGEEDIVMPAAWWQK